MKSQQRLARAGGLPGTASPQGRRDEIEIHKEGRDVDSDHP